MCLCVFFPPQYLGSMLVKELRGTESTQDACAKMRVKHSLTPSPAAIVRAGLKLPSTAGTCDRGNRSYEKKL